MSARCPAFHDDIHYHWIVVETWLHPIGSPAATHFQRGNAQGNGGQTQDILVLIWY